jgi:hypothetical protein
MPLRVHYELALAKGETGPGKASAIAREQTVEIPPGVSPAKVERRTIGAVAAVEELSARRARVAIDYPWRELVSDLPQLVNLLGNISCSAGSGSSASTGRRRSSHNSRGRPAASRACASSSASAEGRFSPER